MLILSIIAGLALILWLANRDKRALERTEKRYRASIEASRRGMVSPYGRARLGEHLD